MIKFIVWFLYFLIIYSLTFVNCLHQFFSVGMFFSLELFSKDPLNITNIKSLWYALQISFLPFHLLFNGDYDIYPV